MRITSKGQVTIPQAVRERAGLMPGAEVDFIIEAGEVKLIKSPRGRRKTRGQIAVDKAAGTMDLGGMTPDEFMRELRGWDDEPPGVLG